MQKSPVEALCFVTLPEDFKLSSKAFPIDPAVPIPVQKKDGSDSAGHLSFQDITQEQILSGILTVLGYDKANPHTDYYRSILLKVRPNIKLELSEAAVLKARNEDWSMAEELFLVLSGIDPDDMAITLNSALFYDQRADFCRSSDMPDDADAYDAEALRLYKKAMDAVPPLPDAFFNAGFFFLKQRDFAEAQGCFESYLALTVDVPDDKMGEGGLYKKERAQEIIESIRSSNLGDQKFKKAYDLISHDKAEEGLSVIRAFIEENPEVWNAWFMAGWGLRKLGRFEQAEQAFLKAIELGGGQNSDCFNELAICQMEGGDLAAAKKSLMSALSISPEDAKIISNLGCLFLREGNRAEARRYFLSVLEFDPNDKIALAELAAMEGN